MSDVSQSYSMERRCRADHAATGIQGMDLSTRDGDLGSQDL